MKTKVKPFTSSELFNLIDKQLRETVLPTDFDFGILDYGLDTYQPVEIRSYQWDTVGIVNFGGSEGIYLDIYADGIVDDTNERKKIHLGTYKTLRDDIDAFREMGSLNAEFVFALRKFVNSHLDDFEWSGFKVLFYQKDSDQYAYGFTYPTFAEAKNRIIRELKRPGAAVTRAVVVNNANSTFTEFNPEAVTNEELINQFLNTCTNKVEWLLGYPVTAYVLETLEDRVREAVANLCEERVDACAGFWKPEWKSEVR